MNKIISLLTHGEMDGLVVTLHVSREDAMQALREQLVTEDSVHGDLDPADFEAIEDAANNEPQFAWEIAEHDNPFEPTKVRGAEAVSFAIFGLNTLMHPDASAPEDVDALEAHVDGVIETLVELREWLTANPEWEERR